MRRGTKAEEMIGWLDDPKVADAVNHNPLWTKPKGVMIHRPIIVVGTGRSGTSTVARLLHHSLGVRMYRDQFLAPDKWNPGGYFEDRKVKRLNKAATTGAITGVTWREQMYDHMRADHSPWGFKLQPLAPLGDDFILDAMDPRAVIACVRDRTMTARSIGKWRRQGKYKGSPDAEARYDIRETAMKSLLHGHIVLWLDFSFERAESYVLERVRSFVSSEVLA